MSTVREQQIKRCSNCKQVITDTEDWDGPFSGNIFEHANHDLCIAAVVRRCAEIADDGTRPVIARDIRREFPEAFK